MSPSQPIKKVNDLKEKVCNFKLTNDEIKKMFISKYSTKCQKCHKLKIKHLISPYDFSSNHRKYICTCGFLSPSQNKKRVDQLMNELGYNDDDSQNPNNNPNHNNDNIDHNIDNAMDIINDIGDLEDNNEHIEPESDNINDQSRPINSNLNNRGGKRRNRQEQNRHEQNGHDDNGDNNRHNNNGDNNNGDNNNRDNDIGYGDNGHNNNGDNNNRHDNNIHNNNGPNGNNGHDNNGQNVNNDFITRQEFNNSIKQINNRITSMGVSLGDRIAKMDERITQIRGDIQTLLNNNHN